MTEVELRVLRHIVFQLKESHASPYYVLPDRDDFMEAVNGLVKSGYLQVYLRERDHRDSLVAEVTMSGLEAVTFADREQAARPTAWDRLKGGDWL